MTKLKTLSLIDDDAIYQFIVREFVRRGQLADQLITFNNGQEALEFLQREDLTEEDYPDIIFLDINMPVMDGWDFLENFKAIRPKLKKPVVLYILSSSINREDIEKAKNYEEVTDYITKPMTEQKLRESIYQLAV